MKVETSKSYKKLKEIGEGGYGKILLVEDLVDHQTYALKKMRTDVGLQAGVGR